MSKRLFSGAVRRGLILAAQETQRSGQQQVQPSHLLAGLLRVVAREPCFAGDLLEHLVGDTTPWLEEVRQACKSPMDYCRFGPMPRSDASNSVLADAHREAQSAKSKYIGTHHILLALAGESAGVAREVLERHGLHRETIADHLWVLGDVNWPFGPAHEALHTS